MDHKVQEWSMGQVIYVKGSLFSWSYGMIQMGNGEKTNEEQREA